MGEVKDLVLTDVEVVVEEGPADDPDIDPVDVEQEADSMRWHQMALGICDDTSKAALEAKRQIEGLWGLKQPKASDTMRKLTGVHATLEKLIKEQV